MILADSASQLDESQNKLVRLRGDGNREAVDHVQCKGKAAILQSCHHGPEHLQPDRLVDGPR